MPNWTRAANWTALAIGAGLILASVECALAADLPPAPSLPPAGPSSEDFSGWYLRGDLGAGFEAAPALNAAANPIASIVPGGVLSPYGTASFRDTTLSPSGTIDAGVGYVLNPWLRMDGTLEYRFGGQTPVVPDDRGSRAARRRRILFRRRRASRRRLLDRRAPQRLRRSRQLLGRHALSRGRRRRRRQCAVGRIRPGARHLGAGPAIPVGGVFSNASRTNFAWALTAGLDFDIAPNLKIEASYRYLNLGSLALGGLHCATGCGGAVAASSRGALVSNDIRIGLIWLVEQPQPARRRSSRGTDRPAALHFRVSRRLRRGAGAGAVAIRGRRL